jgi:hypothetical protein
MEETTSDSVEAEAKDALSLNQVKGEVKEDLTGDYKDVINEIDKNQSV